MIEQLADDGGRTVERTIVLRNSEWTDDGLVRSATLTLVSAQRIDLTLRLRAIPGQGGLGLYWYGQLEGQSRVELTNEGAIALAGLLERAVAAVDRGEAFGVPGVADTFLVTGNGNRLPATVLFDPADPALVLRILDKPIRQMILLPEEARQLAVRLARFAGRPAQSGEAA